MRELSLELEIDRELLCSNVRHSAVLSVRDRRERTGATLRMTLAGKERLMSELAALKDEPGEDRREFTLAADLEVTS